LDSGLETLKRNDQVVSFDSEQLVLVDADDCERGYMLKSDAHEGRGTLHRAFSLFIFNSRGELLLQQRAPGKRLWPGFWSNTCCSHPRKGETMETATERRLFEEIGFRAPLRYLFKFEYQAQYDDTGAEHELCWVYAGRSDAAPHTNANEIAAVRYVAPAALTQEMAEAPERFTPWFKMEWSRIQRDFPEVLQQRQS
jgi:isopentenyl-diphosphate delta-isomerase